MGKYLLLWRLDPARMPVDPKERAGGWSALMSMVEKDFEKGVIKDWGSFTSEGRGYVVVEGSNIEVGLMTEQYVPYCHFETHPLMSASQIKEMLKAMRG
jgi:hypothetical protein